MSPIARASMKIRFLVSSTVVGFVLLSKYARILHRFQPRTDYPLILSHNTPSASSFKISRIGNFESLGKGLTGFGDCVPYCDRKKLKSLLPEFLEVYKKKPWSDNKCGCQVNHCAMNFMVAKVSGAHSIIENGVNAGMSGFLFRQAQPDAEVWHIDPLSKPICDPNQRKRWKDTGRSHYFVGPSDSIYYKEMANVFSKSDGADASVVAKDYGSHGFRDFFEIEWTKTNVDQNTCLVFFDTHQRDFDNILKARALGFKTFILDDNYHTNIGDMAGHSIKQVFYRGNGQAKNLASTLDFYYEMPPIINPLLMDEEMKSRYPKIFEEMSKMNRGSKEGKPVGFVFDPNAQQMGLYQDPLLDLSVQEDRKIFEELATVVKHEEFAWYNHIAVLGIYRT